MTFDWNTSRKMSALGVESPGNTSGVNTNPIGCAETSCDPLPTTASSSATPTTAMRRGQDVCLFMIGSSSGSGSLVITQRPVLASLPSLLPNTPLPYSDSGRLSLGKLPPALHRHLPFSTRLPDV